MKGNKLDFHHAMASDKAEEMYSQFVQRVRQLYKPELVKGNSYCSLLFDKLFQCNSFFFCLDGLFGLYRDIQLSIDGPVTINLDSRKTEPV